MSLQVPPWFLKVSKSRSDVWAPSCHKTVMQTPWIPAPLSSSEQTPPTLLIPLLIGQQETPEGGTGFMPLLVKEKLPRARKPQEGPGGAWVPGRVTAVLVPSSPLMGGRW